MPSGTRISLAKMRELLPPDEEYTDEFLLELRSQLYDLAELALEVYFEKKRHARQLEGEEYT